jgi:hypothetical protein
VSHWNVKKGFETGLSAEGIFDSLLTRLDERVCNIDEPAEWALRDTRAILEMYRKIFFRSGTGWKAIDEEKEIHEYALALTKQYGHDEEVARQQKQAEYEANREWIDSRIIEITMYDNADVSTAPVHPPEVAEDEPDSLEITVDPSQYRKEELTDEMPPATLQDEPEHGNGYDEYVRMRLLELRQKELEDEPYSNPLTWGLRPWPRRK